MSEKLSIKERVKLFARAVIDQKTPEDKFDFEIADGAMRVKAEGKVYDVVGNKRLIVSEHVEKKPRAKKEPRPPAEDVEVKCAGCGKLFVRSRFLPYMDKCKECRKGSYKGTGELKVCTGCGKNFRASKFNPYLVLCPSCRKPKKSAKPKAEKPKVEKKSAT